MITLSSHTPFRWVKGITFRDTGIDSDYLNSIPYTDRCLQKFLSSLQGKHLVLLLGDHASNIESPNYNSRPHGREFIPGMLMLLDNGVPTPPKTTCSPSDLLSGKYDIRRLRVLVRKLIVRDVRP